ncbi:GntR family transcriptional regulator [Pedobacter sp. NJ-S-72]
MPKSSPDILLTFLKLDIHSKKPLYIQLYNEIRDAVHQGMLKYGDRMPSTRALGKYLGISRNIVILAFEQLILEGYLISKTGAGTFICEEIELANKSTRQKTLAIAEEKKEHTGFNPHIICRDMGNI